MTDWPNGSTVKGGGIVPAGSDVRDNKGRPALPTLASVVICALGGYVASTSLSIVAPAIVAYGLAGASARGRLRDLVPGALAALAVAVALGVPEGPVSVADGAIACAASIAVAATLVCGRLTPGALCVIVAAVSASHLGVDAAIAHLGGTTLTESVTSLLEALRQQLVGATPTAAAQLDSVMGLLEVMWPTAYVMTGTVECVMAHAGTSLAAPGKRAAHGGDRTGIAGFDLPIWVVALLVASVAGLACALTVPDAPRALLMVSANLAMSLRFAFLAQGVGVLSWLCEERHVGTLARILGAVLALYLEVQFIVVSIVGLVDVWANFRHLSRGSGPDSTGNAEQDKEPA